MIFVTKSLIRRDKGTHYAHSSYLSPERLALSFFLFSRSSGLTFTGPTLSCLHVFLRPPESLPFPTSRLNSSRVSCASSPLLHPPDPVLRPRPWALVLSMIQLSRWGLWSCGFGCWSLVGVAPPLASFDPPLLPLRRFPCSLSPPPYSLLSSPFPLPFSPLSWSSCPFPRSFSFPSPPTSLFP